MRGGRSTRGWSGPHPATSPCTSEYFMTSSILATIRAFVAPEHLIACRASIWHACLRELALRGGGYRESGAFLLGVERQAAVRPRREIRRFVCYDDLDPCSLDSGIIDFDGVGYNPLWALCRSTGLKVVADVHTHPGPAFQSHSDKRNP